MILWRLRGYIDPEREYLTSDTVLDAPCSFCRLDTGITVTSGRYSGLWPRP
jgi:hypothetical protein